jgi:hypothetical protein
MAVLNAVAAPVTISDTAAHVVLPDQDLMVDPKQPNVNVGLQLSTKTGSTLAGSWKIEVSNDSHLGLTANAQWSDITSAFTPTIAAVLSGASSQYVQCAPIYARAIRASFTATSGSGDAVGSVMAQPALAPVAGVGI